MSSESLEAAAAIGHGIVEDAIWHGGRCTWVGGFEDRAKPWLAEYRALEADLYDGTAGIGLFLAHLASVTGAPDARHTAVGALRHATGRAGRREGFHVGSLGVAWAAATAARLLGDDELDAAAREVAGAAPVADGRLDLVFGSAGSLLARLALAELLDAPALVEDAVAVGEQLLAAATVTGHGWSWAAPEAPRRRHLCGLSHGAAGIGWALLELYAATGDERFRAGAAGAFAYERSWLDRETGTWPDLRIGGQRRDRRVRVPRHRDLVPRGGGHRAHAAARERGPRPRAVRGGSRDRARHDEPGLAAKLPYDIEDLTLCHGAAGAADVLLCAGAEDLPHELGRMTLARHDPASRDWPSGLVAGTTPALFQGLSGIGWWFLRLHDPAIQSPLTMFVRLTPLRATA